MSYLYHYHTQKQLSPGVMKYSDGTIEVRQILNTHEMYREIRKGIAKEVSPDDDGFTICSLTLLNPCGTE